MYIGIALYSPQRIKLNPVSIFEGFLCIVLSSLILWSVLLKRKHSLGLLQATMDYVVLNLPSLHKQL